MGRGRTSMREQYNTFGVENYYTLNGSSYTNPHDADVRRVMGSILGYLLPKIEKAVAEEKSKFKNKASSFQFDEKEDTKPFAVPECHHIDKDNKENESPETCKNKNTLRVLDMACGSGEINLSIKSWFESKYWVADSCFYSDLCLIGTDPFTQESYTSRTDGWPCLSLSFSDIAQGASYLTTVLKNCTQQTGAQNEFVDITVCSFALHLCDNSYLYDLLYHLSLVSRYFVILSPHKKPVIGENQLGGHFTLTADGVQDRIHYRIFKSSMI